MNIKQLLKNISPFNNKTDMPAALYIVKKILAFFFIYGLSAAIGEVLVIVSLTVMGYDPLNGVMPTGFAAQLIQYYGFGIFLIVALIYCKLVGKRTFASIGFNKKIGDYFIGGAGAVLLLAAILGVCCMVGALSFNGISSGVNTAAVIALLGAFFIQSMMEETISRGLIFTTLSEKVSLPIAFFVSATVFALPHLLSILEAEAQFVVIGVVNLYLVSAVFTLLYLLRTNIYIVSGLHCVWNFVLNGVMGLSVSGSTGNENALLCFEVKGENILNGGVYGLEASIVTTAVLGISTVILMILYCKRGRKNGI